MIKFICITAILITGSKYKSKESFSAEIYHPSRKISCSLSVELPRARNEHTQDGPLACGGGWTSSCDQWSQGSWTQSHTLKIQRSRHLSWATESGVYLMGGSYSDMTTELVKKDGSTAEGFKLKHRVG